MPGTPESRAEPYRVFFSHGGEDTYIVKGFLKPKIEESGASVFLDAGEIKYGDDFRKTVLDELASCDELVVLLSRSSIGRAWVCAEIGAAVIRRVRVVVVLYGVAEQELMPTGFLSLLGTNKLLVMANFDTYVLELKARVENGHHA